MVDRNSPQYLRSVVDSGCYRRSDDSTVYEKKINVSGNSEYGVALLTNEL